MAIPGVYNRVYDNDYFSGTQAALYIGDIFIDEVTSFAFRVDQTKTPIYGYASQKFDAVSGGPVLVSGSFTINFKEANYLYLALMRYFSFEREVKAQLMKATKNSTDLVDRFYRSIGLNQNPGNRLPTPFSEYERKITRLGLEGVIRNTSNKEERFNFYQSLSGYASRVGMDVTFEDLTEVLEDAVWGHNPEDADDLVRRVDDNFFDGFDMYFVYGDYNNEASNHTVERITGVHLTSRQKAVTVSGEPIQEEYQFIARDNF